MADVDGGTLTARDAYALAVVRETIARSGSPYVADYVRLELRAAKQMCKLQNS
jgi:hypothetical protein